MNDGPRPERRWLPPAVCALLSLGVFAAVWGLRAAGGLQPLEMACYDLLVRYQRPDRSMASQVVVVGLTEDDIAAKDADKHPRLSFPISDGDLARLLEELLKAGPRSVGVDIARDQTVTKDEEAGREADARLREALKHFAAATTRPAPPPATRPDTPPQAPFDSDLPPRPEKSEGRRRLEAVWNADPRLVMGMVLSPSGMIQGKAEGLPAEQSAFADWPVDDDGIVRRGYLSLGSPAVGTFPSLSSLLAQIYLAQETPPVLLESVPPGDPGAKDLKLGRTTFWHFRPNDGAYVNADAGGIQFLLDYKSLPEGLKHFSVLDVLDGRATAEDIAGKVVLIGVMSPINKDLLNTPLGPRPAGDPFAQFGSARFGVEVHAAAVDQLLRSALNGSRPVRSWPGGVEALWALAWALAGGAVGLRLRSPWQIALAMAGGAGLLAGICWGLFAAGWWVPFVPNVLGWSAAAFGVLSYVSYRERADRQVVEKMLAVNVSDDVAKALWDRRDQFLKDGRITAQPVTATVLFSDLKGFSGVSENMPADRLMAWLNELMEALAEDVYHNGGMVNKYIGDAVMAVFGVPVPSATDADRARDACNGVRAAVAMRATLGGLNRRWKTQGLPEIGMRIGVYTGELIAGQLGSAKRRLEYTVIGDSVNTASRLESFDKRLMDADISADGCRILIGQSTYELLDAAFRTRYIGEMELSGKKVKVAVHGVISHDPAPVGQDRQAPAGADRPVQGTKATRAV